MKLLKAKKGQIFQQLAALGVGVAGLAILLVVAFLIMSQAKTQIVTIDGVNVSDPATFSEGYNATSELQGALDDIPTWIPLIVIAVIGSILLGVVALFSNRG